MDGNNIIIKKTDESITQKRIDDVIKNTDTYRLHKKQPNKIKSHITSLYKNEITETEKIAKDEKVLKKEGIDQKNVIEEKSLLDLPNKKNAVRLLLLIIFIYITIYENGKH